MTTFELHTEGLTRREAMDLLNCLELSPEIESIDMQTLMLKSVSPQAALQPITLLVHLTESGAAGIALAAGNHLYKKLGEELVDKVWDWMRLKFSDEGSTQVSSLLLGPDGQPIKTLKRMR